MNIGHYAKSIAYIITAVLTGLVTAFTDNVVTTTEVVAVVVTGLTAVGVYLVPNLPAGPGGYLKAVVAFLGAGAAALVQVLGAGGFSDVQPAGWLLVIIAAMGGVGVYIVPNEPKYVARHRA